MGKRSVPFERVGLIEEGQFSTDLDEAFSKLNRDLVSHVRKYGPDATRKSKAKLTAEITVEHGEGENFTVKTSISSKVPGRPARVTSALLDVEQTGEERLFVLASGSSSDSPRQMKLATEDGRAIDPDTGKPKKTTPKEAS